MRVHISRVILALLLPPCLLYIYLYILRLSNDSSPTRGFILIEDTGDLVQNLYDLAASMHVAL